MAGNAGGMAGWDPGRLRWSVNEHGLSRHDTEPAATPVLTAKAPAAARTERSAGVVSCFWYKELPGRGRAQTYRAVGRWRRRSLSFTHHPHLS